jgi:hypothetical protein
MNACPICRELHGPERGLSFDGKGVNSCSMYRTRLATFGKDTPEHLGPLFATAPDLLAACAAVLAWADRECMPQGGKNDGPWEVIEAAITKARGQ